MHSSGKRSLRVGHALIERLGRVPSRDAPIALNTVASPIWFRSESPAPPQVRAAQPSGAKTTRAAAAGNTAIFRRRGLHDIAGIIPLVFSRLDRAIYTPNVNVDSRNRHAARRGSAFQRFDGFNRRPPAARVGGGGGGGGAARRRDTRTPCWPFPAY